MKHISLLLFVSVTACSAGAADESKSKTNASPVELCSGKVHCVIEQTAVDATFTRNGDTCYLGELEMTGDGRTVSPDGTWEGTAQHFTMCTNADHLCAVCDAESEARGRTSAKATPRTART